MIFEMNPSLALQDDYQQYEHNDKYQDDRQLLVVLCPHRHVPQLSPRPIQSRLMAVHNLFRIVKHTDLVFQLVADLYTDIPLPSNALPQPVQIFVLSPQYLGMVLVYLLII